MISYLSKTTRLIVVFLFAMVILASCATPSQDGNNTSTNIDSFEFETTDIAMRLNEEGTFAWRQDESAFLGTSTVTAIYFGGECAVWVFPTYDDVKSEFDEGLFDFYNGEVWYGSDQISDQGVALLTEDSLSQCAKVVFDVMNWDREESSSESDESSTDEKTDAYWLGYNGNIGSILAYVEMADSRKEYCESLLDLHPELDSQGEKDYVRGCLDILRESFGSE